MIVDQVQYSTLLSQERRIKEMLKEYQINMQAEINSHDKYVQKIQSYICDHLFNKSLSVNNLLKSTCKLKNNNITTKFRLNVGLGIREYIVVKRMEAAAYVLKQSEDVKVFLLASSIGYDGEYFSQLFKLKYHCTPLEYRYGPRNNHKKIL